MCLLYKPPEKDLGWAKVVWYSLPFWWILHLEQWSTSPKKSLPWQIVLGRISLLEKGICCKKKFSVCESLPRRALRSKTWIRTAKVAIIITLVYCLKFDETGSVRHAIKRITVNTHVISYCYFNGQRSSIFQGYQLSPKEFLKGEHVLLILRWTWFGWPSNVRRMCLEP